MPVDREGRRRVFREGIKEFISSSQEIRRVPIQAYDLVEFVAGMLLDQIADLEARVEELEHRLSTE